jgi:hypothetical protein
MIRASSLGTVFHLSSSLLIAATAMAQQNESRTQPSAQPGQNPPHAVRPEDQRTTGVIIKAESMRKETRTNPGAETTTRDRDRSTGQRLTINTIIPWQDWVRDQVEGNPKATPREQAEKGANSIATRGQPRSENTDVVVEVGPETKVDSRVRLDVEEGATIDAAARAKKASRGSDAMAYRLEDLKPGLFVEVSFARKDGRNVATTVTVVRPVSGPDAVANPAANPGRAKAKK